MALGLAHPGFALITAGIYYRPPAIMTKPPQGDLQAFLDRHLGRFLSKGFHPSPLEVGYKGDDVIRS